MKKESLEKMSKVKKIKKISGITLIALVVTIVVLLILAGITISLVFSENGIIAKAREAAEKTNQAVINEQEQMNEVGTIIDNMLNGIGESTPPKPEGPEMPEGWDGNKVNAVESADKVVVPVPKGYTASSVATENKVSEGFVIYENTNGEDKKEEVNDNNKDTARTTRNQFVWVPVANPSEMYGTDKDGKKWGKLYNFSANGITAKNWTEQDSVISITATSGGSSFREPDIIDADSSNSVTISQLETEFNNMIESVKKYGGFYIGRYETGNLSQEKASIIKNNSDIGNQTWYTMYKKAKGIAVNNNVTSSMIWGSQWDATMRWMYNSGNEEKKKYTYDSRGKGNYSSDSPIATGSIEAYAVNNIYDMAGNVSDWTIEAYSTVLRVTRGGNYSDDGSNGPASVRRSSNPTNSIDNYGFRVALYM
ncbi:MAG: SUMF1/EgtB/PvdO family nonheme iron enzyme [Clostridia bacterium]